MRTASLKTIYSGTGENAENTGNTAAQNEC